ncbi:uncharacterized protein LOC113526632, partial [Tachysurus ichikawai]
MAPPGLFGDAVTAVLHKFQESKQQSAAFQQYLPRRSRGAVRRQPQPNPSGHREAQRQSVATRSPRAGPKGPRRRSRPKTGRGDMRVTLASGDRAVGTTSFPPAVCFPPFHPLPTFPPEIRCGRGGSAASREASSAAGCGPRGLVPLRNFLTAWEELPGVSRWVLRTIVDGYTVQFASSPPRFNGMCPTLVGPEQALVLEREMRALLGKGTIEVVPPSARESGFYSPYFVVPKKDGGWRPILDLRSLNRSLRRLRFRMLTLKEVVTQIRSGDWFVTIDLEDAYFHVSILPAHRRFLRFAFRGEAYQYRVLPFGLALSPRTFTKCVDAALTPLRLQGIRILNYLDDWLILAQSERQAVRHRDVVLACMKGLGFWLNAGKSVLSPAQRTTFLGVIWDSARMQARLSPARVVVILDSVGRVREGQPLSVKQFQRLLGLMAVASSIILLGLLHMRPLQWWLRGRGFSLRGNPYRSIRVSRRALRALDVWKDRTFLSQGPVLGAPCRRMTLTTDASLTGWGAVMSGHSAQGLWSGPRLLWHINCLEMMAVFLGLKHFLPDLGDRHVLVRTDNTAVVSYINHQGGLRSRPLYKLARAVLLWSRDRLSLRAIYIPGRLNVRADALSRQGPRPGEWRLHPEVVELIWRRFYKAQACTPFPPIALLPGVLERVRRDGVRLLLVAPRWPGKPWFADLVSLLEGPPWEIPPRRDLLSQAGGTLVHPRPQLWRLWLWPLRGRSS